MTDNSNSAITQHNTSRTQDSSDPVLEHGSSSNSDQQTSIKKDRIVVTQKSGKQCIDLCATSFEKKYFGRGNETNTIESLKETLQSHFLTTNDSNKKKIRRLSGKGLIHLSSVVLVTVQLILFVQSKLTLTDFLHANKLTFAQLFVVDPISSDQDYTRPIPTPIRVIFTQDELFEQLNYTATQFFHLHQLVGQYSYQWSLEKDPNPPELYLKIDRRIYGQVDPITKTYDVSLERVTDFYNIYNTSDPINDALNWSTILEELPSVVNIQMGLVVSSIYIDVLTSDKILASCFEFNITLNINNHLEKGNGIQVDMDVNARMSSCNNNHSGDSLDLVVFQDQKTIAVDCLVITVSIIYIIQCLRSLVNSWYLIMTVRKLFKNYYAWELSWKHLIPLFKFWFVGAILISITAIIISSLKLRTYDDPNSVEVLDINYIPMIMGLVVFLQWCGILRFLSYFESFNILLVTVKIAMPSVLRLCACVLLLFVSYLLLGWLVLGAYHPKFRDLFTTSESLFSLLNGDDMFKTFEEMSQESTGVWIFSKIYLYTFICLFIFVVLSVFIALVSNTYDEIRKTQGKDVPGELLKDFANDKLVQVPNDFAHGNHSMSKEECIKFLNEELLKDTVLVWVPNDSSDDCKNYCSMSKEECVKFLDENLLKNFVLVWVPNDSDGHKKYCSMSKEKCIQFLKEGLLKDFVFVWMPNDSDGDENNCSISKEKCIEVLNDGHGDFVLVWAPNDSDDHKNYYSMSKEKYIKFLNAIGINRRVMALDTVLSNHHLQIHLKVLL